MFTRRSENQAGFSVAQALFDLDHGRERSDLSPAFIADILHIFLGLQGKGEPVSRITIWSEVNWKAGKPPLSAVNSWTVWRKKFNSACRAMPMAYRLRRLNDAPNGTSR
ncbi:MAG: hypothetical protein M0036_27020 [Desulfobacteraceae bacterium]|nr:hypothetical protein [Desulfobacteraceae bacterium]